MKDKLIQALKLLLADILNHYSLYSEPELENAISQFQLKLLESRAKSDKLQVPLQALPLKDLKSLVKQLDLGLLSIPGQKFKLVSVLNSSIIQEGKEHEFFKSMESIKSGAKTTTSRSKKPSKPSNLNFDGLRKDWLTRRDLDALAKEIDKMTLSDIREIVSSWGVKSRSKQGLIEGTINYIKRMKNLSILGT